MKATLQCLSRKTILFSLLIAMQTLLYVWKDWNFVFFWGLILSQKCTIHCKTFSEFLKTQTSACWWIKFVPNQSSFRMTRSELNLECQNGKEVALVESQCYEYQISDFLSVKNIKFYFWGLVTLKTITSIIKDYWFFVRSLPTKLQAWPFRLINNLHLFIDKWP